MSECDGIQVEKTSNYIKLSIHILLHERVIMTLYKCIGGMCLCHVGVYAKAKVKIAKRRTTCKTVTCSV